jgi:hypothetical protein
MRKPMTAGLALSALFAASGNPSQAARAADSTCTGMKSVCLSHRTAPPRSRQVSGAPLAFFPDHTKRNSATLNGISA